MRILAMLICIGFFYQAEAQSTCKCCTENHKSFDFWLGMWDVYDEDGKLLGTNEVTSIQDHCVIQENWTSKNFSGTSFNYYDPETDTWNQLWLDNQGYRLELKGSFKNGVMELRSQLRESKDGANVYDQITWVYNIDGTVTQTWKLMSKDDEELEVLFKGVYKNRM